MKPLLVQILSYGRPQPAAWVDTQLIYSTPHAILVMPDGSVITQTLDWLKVLEPLTPNKGETNGKPKHSTG